MEGEAKYGGWSGKWRQGGMNWKAHFLTSLKIAGAAVIAIALAGELGLKYSASAGIITVLSIRNTKRETFRSAANRGLAFLCAAAVGALCFWVSDYALWGFAVYLMIFAMICLGAGWQEAIAMDSVLMTHFLAERNMGFEMLSNEALLFCIGTGIGILVNLHLRRKDEEFERLAQEADTRMKEILNGMSCWLIDKNGKACDTESFLRLEEALKEAKLCAAKNYNNAVFHRETYELDYMKMRERQSVILREIHESMKNLSKYEGLCGEESGESARDNAYGGKENGLPEQAQQVGALLGRIEQDYHRDNTVVGLLEKLRMLMVHMKEEPLPASREEFEARAILFYILMQIGNFLEVKRDFIRDSVS